MHWLNKAWCRIFQFCFYKASRFLKWRTPLLLSGPGSVEKLPSVMRERQVKNVLFVTDRTIMNLNLANRLLELLERSGIQVTVFDAVKPNPTIKIAEQTMHAFINNRCQAFVAFGGGSPIDTAKAAAARIARPNKSFADMRGFLKVRKNTPPIFAIPTTAGTGSEVTIASVITDDTTHHKYAVCDPQLIPVCAVLDAELTAGLPPNITAHTGMDALTHAVEAYITFGVSNRCKQLSEKAVRLIFSNIEKTWLNGNDLDARQNMLLASFYAGDSFTRAGLTYAHPIAHTLGGLYNETHGRANAVLLPVVLEAFGDKITRKLTRLAEVAGLPNQGKTPSQMAADFIAAIRRMNHTMDIPDTLNCIRKADIPQIINWAFSEANPWYPVPVIFNQAQIGAIIRKVMRKEGDES